MINLLILGVCAAPSDPPWTPTRMLGSLPGDEVSGHESERWNICALERISLPSAPPLSTLVEGVKRIGKLSPTPSNPTSVSADHRPRQGDGRGALDQGEGSSFRGVMRLRHVFLQNIDSRIFDLDMDARWSKHRRHRVRQRPSRRGCAPHGVQCFDHRESG